ncbi:MAG TPA: hypothetical protein EYO76_13295 [Flavobacteriaceae bacterium]|nr:hypothetical protein [Flavobacteriaceae bacterium]
MKYIGFILVLIVSCSKKETIKTGDVIFREVVSTSELSQAINEVTQTQKVTNYTHMGICFIENDSVKVIHSDADLGVVIQSLNTFLKPSDSTKYNADVYRIKDLTETEAIKTIYNAKALVGEPYNTTYVFEDKGYYCSEFVYEAFKDHQVFQLEPMSFKDPKTNQFHKGWVSHYKELNIEIPEGKLGCNPNGMANNKHLTLVESFRD